MQPSAALKKNGRDHCLGTKKSQWIIIPLLLLCVLGYLKGRSLIWPAAISCGITMAITLLFSFKRTAILLFSYLALFPTASWGERYPFFKGLYYNPIIALALIAALVLWVLFERQNRATQHSNFEKGLLPARSIWALTLCFLYALFFGLFYQAEFSVIRIEFLYLILYMTYLLWRQRPLIELKHLWFALIGITLITSFQFFMLAVSEGGLSTVILGRIVTQQPHLAQITIPFLFTFILFKSTKKEKLLAILAILPITAMAFLSQQRGLWGGLFISILLTFAFAYFQNGLSLKRIMQFMGIVIGGLMLFLAIILLIDYLFTGSILLTLLTRIDFLSNLSMDESWHIRMSEISRALSLWDDHWYTILLGSGLGAKYPTTDWTRSYPYLVDNSFAYVLWKMGIIGLTVYLSFWADFLKKGFRLIKAPISISDKRMAAGIVAAFLGLALIGLTNSCLIQYRFIIFWAFAFALIDRMYNITIK